MMVFSKVAVMVSMKVECSVGLLAGMLAEYLAYLTVAKKVAWKEYRKV